jgi:hypothetical protein
MQRAGPVIEQVFEENERLYFLNNKKIANNELGRLSNLLLMSFYFIHADFTQHYK